MPPGRRPKDPELRARTNKAATAATLPAGGRGRPAPKLPKRNDGLPWHGLAVDFWKDVWASPMAAEFLDADLHGLYVVAALVHDFWSVEDLELSSYDTMTLRRQLSAELTKARSSFGLSPVDRWRLHWTIDHGDGKRHGSARPPAVAPPPPTEGDDPRAMLRAVE